MTVQELIDALNKVEDKSLPVCYYTFHGEYEDIYGVEEHKNIYENFFEIIIWKDFKYEYISFGGFTYMIWQYKS